tara:strand:- start:813 stop:1250 length:438 start_codon:yes stop_codon:yes gene_type:complete
MAKFSVTLKIDSTELFSQQAVKISENDTLTAGGDVVGYGRMVVPSGNAHGSAVPVNVTDSFSSKSYVYLKHTGFDGDGATATALNVLVFNSASTKIQFATLGPGEFMMLPYMGGGDFTDINVCTSDASGTATTDQVTLDYFFVEA